MNETQLGGWMRSLPRTKASPAFTSDVVRRARAEGEVRAERATPFVWRMAAAFAMVVCGTLALQFAVAERAEQAKLAALRQEQQHLQQALQAVKEKAADAEPVVVLENDRGTRVIVDIDSAIQPALLRTYD